MTVFWRTGTSQGRTIYVQRDMEGPSKSDRLIGLMDSPGLADLVVLSVNAYLTALSDRVGPDVNGAEVSEEERAKLAAILTDYVTLKSKTASDDA